MWDGVRVQGIWRGGRVFLWARQGELVTERFPEVARAVEALALGTVIDGVITAFREGRPLPFTALQKRLSRKRVSSRDMDEMPVAFMAFDLLESRGQDVRSQPIEFRRKALRELIPESGSPLYFSEDIAVGSWDAVRALQRAARERHLGGVMLKRRSSTYQSGRVGADWWKWKSDPYLMDAVLLYAERGEDELHREFTFGLWAGEELVPIAKASANFTEAELTKLDEWIRLNTVEKFGPVRSVRPEVVFQLAFDGVLPSARRKSGVTLRLPRVLRQYTEKHPEQADTLERVRSLIGDG